jgi:hypothetical protein
VPADDESAPAQEHEDISSRISRYVNDAHSQVGEPGEGRTWHAICYRSVNYLLTGWRRKLVGPRVRSGLNYVLNFFLSYHSHAVAVAWSRDDPMHNLHVPDDEHVAMPTLWVVELFPPSEFAALAAAIARNKWDRKRVMFGIREANAERLQQARAVPYGSWWRLGEVVAKAGPYWYPDGVQRTLPREFTAVELRAIQLGPSLTAVTAQFHLSETAASTVDRVWHARHEPRLVRRPRGRPQSQDRLWATYALTQETRLGVHEAAREWMASACPGSFSSSDQRQPVVDLLLLDRHDPTTDPTFGDIDDPLRALGLTDHAVYHTASSQLPGLLLAQVEPSLCKTFEGRSRTWALWGSRAKAAAAVRQGGYGNDVDRAIGHVADDTIRNDVLVLACLELQAMFEQRYSIARDQARTQHGRFRLRHLKLLREGLLTSSIDLTSLSRDFAKFDARGLAGGSFGQFQTALAPRIRQMDEQDGRPVRPPIDLAAGLLDRLKQNSERLLAIDRDYRDILTTVASLGTSIDTVKIGRYVLVVALVSLAVSIAALIAAQL